ncbi:hypothetical protein [Streptomyces mexicanus]|nr:hypothetical protein [Streptomyces mexicanus]
MELLGHANIGITAQVYAHVRLRLQHDPINQLGDVRQRCRQVALGAWLTEASAESLNRQVKPFPPQCCRPFPQFRSLHISVPNNC